MKKKKINKQYIQKIIHSLPKEIKEKMMVTIKSGKKVTLKLNSRKNLQNMISPYQDK